MRRCNARQVIRYRRAAERYRDLQHRLAGARQLLGVHRDVGRAEIDVLGGELLDAAAAADRLIVDRHVGVLLIINVEGFGKERVVEARSGPGQLRSGDAGRAMATATRGRRKATNEGPLTRNSLSGVGTL